MRPQLGNRARHETNRHETNRHEAKISSDQAFIYVVGYIGLYLGSFSSELQQGKRPW